MGTLVLTDAHIIIDGNTLSSKSNSVGLSFERDTSDETAFGDDTHKNKAGLKNWSGDISFHQDFADNSVDEILFGLWNAGEPFDIEIRATSANRGASNPAYVASAIITNYNPFAQGGVGELGSASISLVPAGDDNTMQRLTS